MKKGLVMLGLFMALVASQAFALDIPALKGRINDYAAMLTPGGASDGEQRF